MRSSVPLISPALTAPLLITTPLPPVALTISLAPAIQFLLLVAAPPTAPGSSCFVMPLNTISKTTPARCNVLTRPRFSGKGRRGEREGSSVMSVGAKGEGGERERATWEKEEREVGVTERRLVEAGKRGAVELD